jgi:endonuclease G
MASRKRPKQTRRPEQATRALVGRSPAAHPGFTHDPKISDQVVEVYHQAMSRYRTRPDVTGIDIGFEITDGEETGRVAVRVHVLEKVVKGLLTPRELFPETINGVPVDVIQAGYRRQDGGGVPGGARFATLQPGISVAHFQTTAGTLGMFVRDANIPAEYLLGASHVLAPDDSSQAGDPILQPSPDDGGSQGADTIAALARFNLDTDSGIATLSGARPTTPGTFCNGQMFSSFRSPVLGETLGKCGRTSGFTEGRVDGIGEHGDGRFSFRLKAVNLNGHLPISEGGDSGAIWSPAMERRWVFTWREGPSLTPPMSRR